jgi:hypothetical protein
MKLSKTLLLNSCYPFYLITLIFLFLLYGLSFAFANNSSFTYYFVQQANPSGTTRGNDGTGSNTGDQPWYELGSIPIQITNTTGGSNQTTSNSP